MEGEIKIWRAGDSVDSENQVTWEKVNGAEEKPTIQQQTGRPSNDISTRKSALSRASVSNGSPAFDSASGTPSSSRVASPTPPPGFNDSILAELSTRPGTPSPTMGDDERESFLRRENELADQLSEKERELVNTTKTNEALKEEIVFLKKDTEEFSKRNTMLATETNQLRMELEKIQFDYKEARITIDSITESNSEMKQELERVKSELEALKIHSQEAADGNVIASSGKDREQIKLERIAAMVQDMEGARGISQQESSMVDLLHALVDSGGDDGKQIQAIAELRKKVGEQEASVQHYKQLTHELETSNATLIQKRDEVENQYTKLLEEYEEVLEKSIAAEEEQSKETETIADFKRKLETQYTSKIQEQARELSVLKDESRRRAEEIASLNLALSQHKQEKQSLEAKAEKLQMELRSISSGDTSLNETLPDGQTAAEYIAIKEREMQQMRRDMAQRILEYDTMRKSLMRDVQNRCEKIIELEMALDEAREQVNQLTRRVNNPAQPQRMALLEKKIAQVTMMKKELVVQNTDLKKQATLGERKLAARSERIEHLQARLNTVAKERELIRQKYEEVCAQRNLEKSLAAKNHDQNRSGYGFGRVVKPLRGGGRMATNAMPQNKDYIPETIMLSPPPTNNNNKRNSWLSWRGGSN